VLLPLSIVVSLFGWSLYVYWGEPASVMQEVGYLFVWQFGFKLCHGRTIVHSSTREVVATKAEVARIRHRAAIYNMHDVQAFNLRMYGSKVIDTNR